MRMFKHARSTTVGIAAACAVALIATSTGAVAKPDPSKASPDFRKAVTERADPAGHLPFRHQGGQRAGGRCWRRGDLQPRQRRFHGQLRGHHRCPRGHPGRGHQLGQRGRAGRGWYAAPPGHRHGERAPDDLQRPRRDVARQRRQRQLLRQPGTGRRGDAVRRSQRRLRPVHRQRGPARGLCTGAEGIKTTEEAAEYGGAAGTAYDPCHHQTGDTRANISMPGPDHPLRRGRARNLRAGTQHEGGERPGPRPSRHGKTKLAARGQVDLRGHNAVR